MESTGGVHGEWLHCPRAFVAPVLAHKLRHEGVVRDLRRRGRAELA
jgi:hypothetical protein